ncbi:hypothetical protein HPB47_003579 [Ixodes persulcatus]|uniref:Uncharacterized protein n=1 Tax=Ixodes persulcatus TaxID=34615 RepID=A0AC60PJR2_IXOPE|nr:hypothetical protein HPB47_003579 [Ixodes persulcatus]
MRAFWILLTTGVLGLYTSMSEDSPTSYLSSRRQDPSFMETRRGITRWFRRYIDAERERLRSIQRRLDVLDVARRSAEGVDPEEYLGLPMNAFLLIKRLAKDYVEVLQDAKDETNTRLLMDMRPGGKRGKRFRFPKPKDIARAAQGVLEYQKGHAYSSRDIAAGLTVGPESKMRNVEMTALDCFLIGVRAYEVNDTITSREWMEEALERSDDRTADVSRVNEYLAYFSFLDGDLDLAMKITDEILDRNPENLKAFLNLEYYQTAGITLDKPVATPLQFSSFRLERTYEPLCRVVNTVNTYRDGVRREDISKDPLMTTYRGVLNERETSTLVNWFSHGDETYRGAAIKALSQLSRTLESLVGLKMADSVMEWKVLTAFCDSSTWLSPGHQLRIKPLATWWVFLGNGSTYYNNMDVITSNIDVSAKTSLFRYHVNDDGSRDKELIPYRCTYGERVILYKRILLEDQPKDDRWDIHCPGSILTATKTQDLSLPSNCKTPEVHPDATVIV